MVPVTAIQVGAAQHVHQPCSQRRIIVQWVRHTTERSDGARVLSGSEARIGNTAAMFSALCMLLDKYIMKRLNTTHLLRAAVVIRKA